MIKTYKAHSKKSGLFLFFNSIQNMFQNIKVWRSFYHLFSLWALKHSINEPPKDIYDAKNTLYTMLNEV